MNESRNEEEIFEQVLNKSELYHSMIEAAIQTCVEVTNVNNESLSSLEEDCLKKYLEKYSKIK